MAMFKCSGALFNGTIQINTTAGATVTATTSGTTRTFTAVADAGGLATIRVKKRGVYAIASTGTARLGHANVLTNAITTAYYEWQKWDSLLQYYQSSRWVDPNSYPNTNYIWTNTGYPYKARGYCTGYTFDTNTGLFTLIGGYVCEQTSGNYTYVASSPNNPYVGYPDNHDGSTITTQVAQATGEYGKALMNGGYFYFGNTGGYCHYCGGSTYIKGSMQYSNANGTTLDAYPSNGRYSTDGYWYIAI